MPEQYQHHPFRHNICASYTRKILPEELKQNTIFTYKLIKIFKR